MNKNIKIAGLSAVVLGVGAVPTANLFAADSLNPITDTVKVTIASACSLSGSGANINETMTNNQTKNNFTGATYTIKCNDAGGWHLSAVGSSSTTDKTSMIATGSGTAIATGTATTGASTWAFKVTGKSGADKTVEGYRSFSAIPATAADVALDTNGSIGQTGTTVSTTYQVHISDTQQADTYTGKVTYTLAHPKTSS